MPDSSAATRRSTRNRAIVEAHPRWLGIRHPGLIAFPPRRFSRLDMLPAEERGRAWPVPRPAPGRRAAWELRAERNRELVAGHPRWRRIVHPERIVFPVEDAPAASALLAYRAAIRLAATHLRRSEELSAEIAEVAAALDHRRWPFSTDPTAAPGARHEKRPPRRRRPRPDLRSLLGRRFPVHAPRFGHPAASH